MRKSIHSLLTIIATLSISQAGMAASSLNQNLQSLGFKGTATASSDVVLSAQSLALRILGAVTVDKLDQKGLEDLAGFATKMLMLKPLFLTDEMPVELEQNELSKRQYIQRLLEDAVSNQSANILADLIYVTNPGEQKKEVAKKMARADYLNGQTKSLLDAITYHVKSIYFDKLGGRSGLLGYALVSGLASMKNDKVSAALEKSLEKLGMSLEVFTKSELSIPSSNPEKSEPTAVSVKTGDTVTLSTPLGNFSGVIVNYENKELNLSSTWISIVFDGKVHLLPAASLLRFANSIELQSRNYPLNREIVLASIEENDASLVSGFPEALLKKAEQSPLSGTRKWWNTKKSGPFVINKDRRFSNELQTFGPKLEPIDGRFGLLSRKILAQAKLDLNPANSSEIVDSYLKLISEKNSKSPADNTGSVDDMMSVQGGDLKVEKLSKDLKAEIKPFEEFLVRVGFMKFTDTMKYNMKNRKSELNALQIRGIKENLRSYDTVDASRELAARIFAVVQSRLNDDKQRIRILDLEAQFLTLQKESPPVYLPDDIKLMEEKQQEEAVMKYMTTATKKSMEIHTRKILSDIVDTMYGESALSDSNPEMKKEVESLYDLVARVVDRMYLDPQIGQTKFLGRAFGALLLRQAALNEKAKSGVTYTQLASELQKRLTVRGIKGEYLSNYFGNHLAIKKDLDTNGKELAQGVNQYDWVPLETGALILNRNIDFESAGIVSGSLASDPKLSEQFKLNGKLLSGLLAVSADELEDGYGWLSKKRDELSQKTMGLNDGFSHVGYVIVMTDPETQVTMSWVVDNYPYPIDTNGVYGTYGGVRFLGVEHFASYAHYKKVGVATYDHEKFHAWARKQTYPENNEAFPSFAIEVNSGEMLVKPKQPIPQPWPMMISREEFERMKSLKAGQMPDHDLWYRDVSNKAMNRILEMLTEGVFFSWVSEGIYYYGGTYCSELGIIAWMQATGINIEEKADKYSKAAQVVQKLGDVLDYLELKDKLGPLTAQIQQSQDLRNLHRLYAPAGLVAQDYVKSFQIVDFKDRSLLGREKTSTAPNYVELNPELTKRIDNALGVKSKFINYQINPGEAEVLKEANLEYLVIKAAHEGISSKLLRKGLKFKATKKGLKN